MGSSLILCVDIYNFLISQTEIIDYQNSYRAARLRLALALLVITGIRIRISELLPLKMIQIKTLFNESWISIDRSKRGPASRKTFLTREGIKLIGTTALTYIIYAENKNKSLKSLNLKIEM